MAFSRSPMPKWSGLSDVDGICEAAKYRTPAVRYRVYAADVAEYTVKPLRCDTWYAFARLVERHNGVWGGCWCLSFHSKFPERGQSVEGNRALKQRLVYEDQAHGSVVFDGDRAVGWCQYGTPEELPRMDHRKEYEAGLVKRPDYRLTCFFVDRDYRREGVSAVALRGALDLIAEAGGGVVEGYPRDTPGERRSRPRSSTTAPEASSNRLASSTSGPRARTIV